MAQDPVPTVMWNDAEFRLDFMEFVQRKKLADKNWVFHLHVRTPVHPKPRRPQLHLAKPADLLLGPDGKPLR